MKPCENFLGELTQTLTKDLQNRELFRKHFTTGEACVVLFTYLIVGMQTSREWRDPTRLETSASLHEDQGKSDQLEAVNCGE